MFLVVIKYNIMLIVVLCRLNFDYVIELFKLINKFVMVVFIKLVNELVIIVLILRWVILLWWFGVILFKLLIKIVIELKFVKLYNVKVIIVLVLLVSIIGVLGDKYLVNFK